MGQVCPIIKFTASQIITVYFSKLNVKTSLSCSIYSITVWKQLQYYSLKFFHSAFTWWHLAMLDQKTWKPAGLGLKKLFYPGTFDCILGSALYLDSHTFSKRSSWNNCTCNYNNCNIFYLQNWIFQCCHWHICLSIGLSVMLCIVAKRYILQQKCLNKWIGSAP